MLNMKILITFLVTTLIFSCKKGNDNLPFDFYKDYPLADNTNVDLVCGGSNCWTECEDDRQRTRYDYYHASFNPNNDEEIAYVRYDNSVFSLSYELWAYNFRTKEKKKIYDNVFPHIDWGVNDFILFVAPDLQIYKIKSSGDSLTHLTFSGAVNRLPVWNLIGNKFVYNTQTNSQQHNFITTSDGLIVDTVEVAANSSGAWSSDDLVPYAGGGDGEFEVGYRNIYTASRTIVYRTNIPESPIRNNDYMGQAATWLNENQIIWVTNKHVGITDIHTGETEVILEGYKNRWYKDVTVSPNKRYIVLSRKDVEDVDYCLIDEKYRLYLYDLEEKTERWLNIEE